MQKSLPAVGQGLPMQSGCPGEWGRGDGAQTFPSQPWCIGRLCKAPSQHEAKPALCNAEQVNRSWELTLGQTGEVWALFLLLLLQRAVLPH